jgi:hypothetical protein
MGKGVLSDESGGLIYRGQVELRDETGVLGSANIASSVGVLMSITRSEDV